MGSGEVDALLDQGVIDVWRGCQEDLTFHAEEDGTVVKLWMMLELDHEVAVGGQQAL